MIKTITLSILLSLFYISGFTQTCVSENTIEIISTSFGSPFSGPFLPGEQIEVRYTIANYRADPIGSGNNCEWLQAIIPEFGNGWDLESFDLNGKPAFISNEIEPFSNNASWDWYNDATYTSTSTKLDIGDFDQDVFPDLCHVSEDDCTNPGIISGEILPPGWYASTGSMEPSESYGDGNCCNCDMGPWTVSFLLTTRTQDYEFFDDLSIKFYTLADGQSGLWGTQNSIFNSVCQEDFPVIFETNTSCYIQSNIIEGQSQSICSGISTIIDFQSSGDYSQIIYSSLDGNISGSSPVWSLDIENNTQDIVSYEFNVELISNFGCIGDPVLFTVNVLPQIQIDLNDESYCSAGLIDLGGNPTATNFLSEISSYEWSVNGLGNQANPEILLSESLNYNVTVTDDNFCTEVASNVIEVIDLGGFEIVPLDSICNNALQTTVTSTINNPNVQWFINDNFYETSDSISIDYSDETLNVLTINAYYTEDYCNVENEKSIYLNTIPSFDFNTNNQTYICPEGLNLAPININTNPISYLWTSNNLLSIDSVLSIQEAGIYSLEITNEYNCTNSENLEILTEDLPDFKIIGDSITCKLNDLSTLSIENYTDSVNWYIDGLFYLNIDTLIISGDLIGIGFHEIKAFFTSPQGCEFELTTNLNLAINAGLNIIEDSLIVCIDIPNYLSLEQDSSYNSTTWTSPSNQVFSDSVLIDLEGQYYVEIITNIGCIITDSVYVSTNSITDLEILGDTSICSKEDEIILYISNDNNATINWFINNDLFNSEDSITLDITNPGFGNHSISANISYLGCQNNLLQDIHIDTLFNIIFENFEDSLIICPEDIISFEEELYGSYLIEWETPEGSTTSDSIVFSGNGYYSFSIDNNYNCFVSDSIYIDSFEISQAIIDGDSLICKNEMSILSIPNIYESVFWNTDEETFEISVGEGSYFAQVMDTNNCSFSSDTIQVIEEILESSFDFNLTETTAEFINNSINGTSFIWDFGDETTSIEENPIHTYDEPNTYSVELIANSIMCSDTLVQNVTIEIDNLEQIYDSIDLYPNPSYSYFNLVGLDNFQYNSISLINSLGQEISTVSKSEFNNKIFAPEPGLYFIKIDFSDNTNILLKAISY